MAAVLRSDSGRCGYSGSWMIFPGGAARHTQRMILLVRPATTSDAADIAAVHVDAWRRAYRGLISQGYLDALSVSDRAHTWAQMIGEPKTDGSAILVAELDGQCIGFATTGRSRDQDANAHTGELRGLYVHPVHWRSGHGHVLHNEAMNVLWCADLTAATLWVLTANLRARQFYEKHGWLPDGAHKRDQRGDQILHETRYTLGRFPPR